MCTDTNNPVIAIDGPAASGKSTVARALAERLGFLHVDSGAFYRGVTWWCLQQGMDPPGGTEPPAALAAVPWSFSTTAGSVVFTLAGQDPGIALRAGDVAARVSDYATSAAVRALVNQKLRALQSMGPLVVEGRDIGTVVFPATAHKFYIDADPAERARRRAVDLERLAQPQAQQEVLEALRQRDHQDRTRRCDPLRRAPDAVVLDTTHLSVDEVVERLLQALSARGIAP